MITIELAGHTFCIDNQYAYVENMCRGYLVPDDPAACRICISEAERKAENRDGGSWPQPYLESLAVYRKICENLADQDIVLFHCSSLTIPGPGWSGGFIHGPQRNRQIHPRPSVA